MTEEQEDLAAELSLTGGRAWARLHDVPPEQVSAAFFYAATGETVRPVDVLDESGLVDLLRRSTAAP